jgi:hypothetical protein
MQLRVFLEPRITEDGCKRYFQLEMDPEGEDVVPVASVMAGEPYLHLNTETGSAEGCFFAFIADFDDPQGTLRAETLNTFGHVDTVAACHQIDAPAPLTAGKTRAGLVCFMGAILASAHAPSDIWQRRWVILKDWRVVRFFDNPDGAYRPKELEHNEMFPGVRTTPGHCQEKRKVIGDYSELAAILWNQPIKLHAEGTRVLTTLSCRKDHPHYVPEKALRHWAMYKRPDELPLPGGLRAIQAQTLSAGTLLYAMTVYDETHKNAFSRGDFGGGAGPSDGGNNSDGGPKKGKKPKKGTSQVASGKTSTSALGSKGTKRKAEQGAGEGSRGAKTKKRPSRVGTTASAIVAGWGPTTSTSHAGEWDAAIQKAVTGLGSNFVRMQKLLARLQDSLPENQPAHGLPLGDFFRLQGKLANWLDPNPERQVNPASHALMGFCGTVLLPAALGISVEAVRFVIILLRALLNEVDPVLDRVEKRLEGKRRVDDKDDGTGRNKNGMQTATKQTGGQQKTGTGGGQEQRDKSGAKGTKGRQRPLVTPTHTVAQTATSLPPPARTVAPIAVPVAIIPKPKATVHSAGPTPTQHPLQGTWLSVTLTARGSCVVAVLVKVQLRTSKAPSLYRHASLS